MDDLNAQLLDRDSQIESLEQKIIESKNHQSVVDMSDSVDFECFATESNVSSSR